MRVDNQAAYLIHSRQYTDSKVILNVLTPDYGRVSLVHRQSPKSKKSKLQAFTPLSCSWQGKSALKTAMQIEMLHPAFQLQGNALYCGIYLNELVERCLAQDDPHEEIYYSYQRAVARLSELGREETQIDIERSLRSFEFQLLESLGFAIDFEYDVQQAPIVQNSQSAYVFVVDEGFVPLAVDDEKSRNESLLRRDVFPSKAIHDIKAGEFNSEALKYAKRLARIALQPLLGSKPLKARELFH
ncbi:MAG: DNA repair protein RecO [Agarilytica sp.]